MTSLEPGMTGSKEAGAGLWNDSAMGYVTEGNKSTE